jgi:iron-sulfur cluster assembly protein
MTEVKKHSVETGLNIHLTEAAKHQVLSYLGKQGQPLGLKLAVKKTGCSGLSYVLDYVTAPEEDDIAEQIDGKFWIYVDKKSYPYLKGLQMDYVKQGLNFKMVFQNPNQTGQCGCGESFTVNE